MDKIIFIYNAKKGLIADVKGAMLKILSPSKYECDLCKITYGIVSVKDDWRIYLASLNFEKVFLHKDELVGKNSKYKNYPLPTILLEKNEDIIELINKEEFNSIKNTQDLIGVLDSKINK